MDLWLMKKGWGLQWPTVEGHRLALLARGVSQGCPVLHCLSDDFMELAQGQPLAG